MALALEKTNKTKWIYNFLIGLVFVFVAVIVTITQIKEKTYRRRDGFTWGNVQFTTAALISYMAGIYMIVNSF